MTALTRYHNVPLYETPLGFEPIGELMIAGKIAIGGEESAALTICGRVSEKDGIVTRLIVAAMAVTSGANLTAQQTGLFAKLGSI